MENNEVKIKKEIKKSLVTVSKVYKSEYQKENTLTAELRQTVTTKALYPTKKISSELQDNPFNMQEFGFEETPFESVETRVAFIDVPKTETIESVGSKLAANPNQTLYRIMSNRPILSTSQEHSISIGQKTMDDFVESQVVRYPKNHEEKPLKLALDKNGKLQYRAVFYKAEATEDIDYRSDDPENIFTTEKLVEELNNADTIANHVIEQVL